MATDKLLDSIRQIGVYLHQHAGTELFDTIMESQCAALRTMINKQSSMTAERATSLTQAVQTGPWSEAAKTSLLSEISHKLHGAPMTDDRYQHLEDNFEEFLPEKMFLSWQDSSPSVVSTVLQGAVDVLIALGIYVPSEHTKGHVVKTALEISGIGCDRSFYNHLCSFKKKHAVTTSVH